MPWARVGHDAAASRCARTADDAPNEAEGSEDGARFGASADQRASPRKRARRSVAKNAAVSGRTSSLSGATGITPSEVRFVRAWGARRHSKSPSSNCTSAVPSACTRWTCPEKAREPFHSALTSDPTLSALPFESVVVSVASRRDGCASCSASSSESVSSAGVLDGDADGSDEDEAAAVKVAAISQRHVTIRTSNSVKAAAL